LFVQKALWIVQAALWFVRTSFCACPTVLRCDPR
jgi:hypothetical protein